MSMYEAVVAAKIEKEKGRKKRFSEIELPVISGDEEQVLRDENFDKFLRIERHVMGILFGVNSEDGKMEALPEREKIIERWMFGKQYEKEIYDPKNQKGMSWLICRCLLYNKRLPEGEKELSERRIARYVADRFPVSIEDRILLEELSKKTV